MGGLPRFPHGTLITVLMVSVLVVVAPAPQARADTQADLAQAIEQVSTLEAAAEASYQEYRTADAHFTQVQNRLAELNELLRAQVAQVEESRKAMARVARASYMAGGVDSALYLLVADDPHAFADSVSDLSRASAAVSTDLAANRDVEQRLAATQQQVAAADLLAQGLRSQAAAAYRQAQRQLAQARAEQSALERKFAAELAEQLRWAEQEAARQAAAEMAAERAAAAAERAAAAASPHRPQSNRPPANPVANTSSAQRRQLINYAMAQLGAGYQLGGKGPDVFDCSGLVAAAYRAAGVSIPSYTRALAQDARPVPLSRAQPGDVVFFFGQGADHVGIYLGNGRMVHAANPRSGVLVSSLSESWYAPRFTMIGQLL